MSAPALGFIKMSLFVQYYYLFGVMRYIRISVLIIGTLTTIFYLSISITAFAMNSPWPGESLLDVIVSWHYLKFAKSSIATGMIGMFVDWVLLFLPVPAVWHLKISRRKKASVMLIFMTGTLGAIASVLSLYCRVVLQRDPTDTTWKVGYTLLWTQVEMWSGVTASCMPTVKQFFSHYFPTASLDKKPEQSTSHSRRVNEGRNLKPGGSFRLWGYKSSTHTESTEQITQGSNCSRTEVADRSGATANQSGQLE
ncbi:hypothetical protein HBI55_181490 [Parastagonospora nodorum]|nr:hypothetical protein HBI14_210870 [Parastagonospora nodorum]KAH6487244.1 hypothetical protein HBI55_181490 [Parastagonospora nodorum]